MMLSRFATRTAADSPVRVQWDDTACPLCGSTATAVVRESADPAGVEGLIFSVVQCTRCAMQYTNPRPDESSIGQFYPQDYKPHRRSEKSQRPPRRSLLTRIAGGDCPERRGDLPVPGPGRLLDFGCGGGSFLARMHRRGWDVTGLDMAPDAVHSIRDTLNLKAHVGTLPHEDLQPGSFDCVTMWHSLEHVHDPLRVLRAAFDLLTPGGHLIVACPNIASWPAETFGSDWYGLDLPRHLTHFTPDTLEQMLTLAGFRTTSLRMVKHSDWLRSSALLAARRGHSTGIKHWLTRKPLAKLAAWMTYFLGTSDCMMAVAVRPA